MRRRCRSAIIAVALAFVALAAGCGTPPAAAPRRGRERTLRGSDDALRRVAELPAAEAGGRRARLLRRRDGRAAARSDRIRQPPGRDRSDELADPAAGRLLRRPRRDERPRLRSSRAQAVGEQPGVLRDGVHATKATSRRARARSRPAASTCGNTRSRCRPSDAAAIDAGLQPIPKLLEQAKTNLTGNQKDLWTYGAKAIKAAERRPRGVCREARRHAAGPQGDGRESQDRHRRAGRVARQPGCRARRGRRASASTTTTGI